METSLRGHRERGNSGRRRGHSRKRFEPGESSSSPFKQFRRASSLPQSVSAEQENGNEAGTSSITDRLLGPRKAIWEYFKRHGEVVKVFIPAINQRPRYKDSTFAFVKGGM